MPPASFQATGALRLRAMITMVFAPGGETEIYPIQREIQVQPCLPVADRINLSQFRHAQSQSAMTDKQAVVTGAFWGCP
jgi:hypothetical protein